MPKRSDILADSAVIDAIKNAEATLDGNGRINVRLSGTEPKARVMVEAEDEAVMLSVGQGVADLIQQKFGT